MGAFWHVTAAAEPTWGIPGPVLLQFYIVLCLVAVVVLARARRANGGLGPLLLLPLTPWHVAVFSNSAATMKGTVLAELYAAGVINDNGQLARQPQPGERFSAPAMAVYQHLARQPGAVADQDFLRLPGIAEQVAASRNLLAESGYLTPDTPQARRRAKRCFALFAGVFGLGIVRTIVGAGNGQPVLWLILSMVVFVFVGAWFFPRSAGLPTKEG